MPQFNSQKQAKEYLVGRIVAEAERENVPLSGIERKMLYVSETDGASPGMLELNAEFERDYDDTEYEQKIAGLIRNLIANASSEESDTWYQAVQKLSEGDHYLLLLIDAGMEQRLTSGVPRSLAPWFPILNNEAPRKPGDRARLVVAALIIALVLIGLGAIRSHFE